MIVITKQKSLKKFRVHPSELNYLLLLTDVRGTVSSKPVFNFLSFVISSVSPHSEKVDSNICDNLLEIDISDCVLKKYWNESLEQLCLQGHIENEVDMSSVSSCSGRCSDYNVTRSVKILHNPKQIKQNSFHSSQCNS